MAMHGLGSGEATQASLRSEGSHCAVVAIDGTAPARWLSASPAAVQWTLSGLEALGIDTHAVLASTRLTEVREAGLEEPQMIALWSAAAHDQPGLGVRMAERLQLSDFGLLGRLLGASSTLGEATLLGTQLTRLIAPGFTLSFHVEGAHASLALVPPPGRALLPDLAELVIAGCVVVARRLLGQTVQPRAVCFAHDAPRTIEHQRRVLGLLPRYGGARSVLHFDSAILRLPIRSGDPREKHALAFKAEKRLSAIDASNDFAYQVRRAIAGELGHNAAQCKRVAGRLGLHPKALTRRLSAHGICYRELVESVRHELAERYLGRPEARVGEIALMLGFSEKSAFNRAFKRWRGYPPSEYRKRLGLSSC